MNKQKISEVEPNIRRGFRIRVDRILYRAYHWQPYLEIQISIETVRHVPLRIVGSELFLNYNAQEVGPLATLQRPYELRETGEGIEIRMRRDLYPTLDKELTEKKGTEQYFQIRGTLLVEAPGYEGQLEIPMDVSHPVKL